MSKSFKQLIAHPCTFVKLGMREEAGIYVMREELGYATTQLH